MSKTVEDIRKLGRQDAVEQCMESGSTATPCGGWGSWLIEVLGGYSVCVLFGEDPEDNQDGWSDAMSAKLKAYHAGAVEGAESVRLQST